MAYPSSVPHLFALASGVPCDGPHACYYCGAPCGESNPSATHVKHSFTGRTGVVAPGSSYVCDGCLLCLRESAEIVLVDGEIRQGQMMRGYSWVITASSILAATKAHLDRLRSLCLDPPSRPFAIVLSDSGQTHQLYRGVVNRGRDPITVTIEAERVSYRTRELRARLNLCGKIVAATGKPALKEPISIRLASAVMDRYQAGESLLSEWERVREQPLSRLAGWLCGNKEFCQDVHPTDAACD